MAAKRVIFGLTTVGAGTTALFAGFFPTAQTRSGTALTVVGCLLIIALASGMVARKSCALWMWVAYPFAAMAIIAVLDLGSRDASFTAQIFFIFPVLYAGAQLSRAAAGAVTGSRDRRRPRDHSCAIGLADRGGGRQFSCRCRHRRDALLVGAGERNDVLIAELEHHAAIDPLTGLVTRRVLDRVASAALQVSSSNLGTAMLLVDLDHFKQVNDLYGHPAGDVGAATAGRRSDRGESPHRCRQSDGR